MWDSSRAHFSPGTDRSSWMFKSVLSQQVNGFHFFYARWVLFLRFFSSLVPCFFFFFFCPFISVQWACLEITHYAQPNKLTDSGMGHSVIRWRQYHLVWRWATTASLISCFLPSINTTPLLRKCLRHAGTWLPLPPSSSLPSPHGLCVTSAPAQARISLLLSGVTKGYIPRFTAYMPYWNAKCCLIFVLFWRSIKKKNNLALHLFFYVSGLQGGPGFEKAICSLKVSPLSMLCYRF